MTFLIASSFLDSLTALTVDEQDAVKQTAFELQLNPISVGKSVHRVDNSKDKNFWSARVNDDLRIIFHRTNESLLLCYADHHDAAYRWAERRKLDTHPITGAAQLVEVQEVVQEVLKHVVVPVFVEDEPPPRAPVLGHVAADVLLEYGVPSDLVDLVLAANEDELLEIAVHLPSEAGQAVLGLAVGETPATSPRAADGADPFRHPDALQRFRVVDNIEELERALAYPWEKWTVFLHPSQRDVATRNFNGPARVSGSAGTGKTVVALHRAVHLAEVDNDARVLLSTFSDALAGHLQTKLRRLLHDRPKMGERIEVVPLDALVARLYRLEFGSPARLVEPTELRKLILSEGARLEGATFSESFLVSEWEQVVDAWQLRTWESYQSVQRLGRKIRLPEAARRRLWSVYEPVREELEKRDQTTLATVYNQLADALAGRDRLPFDHVVLDEAQDASPAQLRFLARLGGDRPNGLFFAGDLGQRIFQQPFSWLSLGVDVRGRARTLKVNYRTSHQIRSKADRLLGAEVQDVDGETETRRGTVSLFNGPEPVVRKFDTVDDEATAVGIWLGELVEDGLRVDEIGLFVRSTEQLPRALEAVAKAGQTANVLDEGERASGRVNLATMHLAKGLEFRAVAAMACDADVLPLSSRIDAAADMVELDEVQETERQLLYVAMTRARDVLWVSGVEPVTEFIEDL